MKQTSYYVISLFLSIIFSTFFTPAQEIHENGTFDQGSSSDTLISTTDSEKDGAQQNRIDHGTSITISLTGLPDGAIPFEMVFIQPGTFMMGSPIDERGRDSNEKLHQVTLTKGFFIGKHEVTQAQYKAVIHENPSHFKGPNKPVDLVTWFDAARFCNRLSEMKGFRPLYSESGDWRAPIKAFGYRLPTEAEWEYACRAGTQTRFSHGDVLECNDSCGPCQLHNLHMWYCGNSRMSGTRVVGFKFANPWNLNDMHGNVREWCNDWYGSYSLEQQVDPTGQRHVSARVLRGGSRGSEAKDCRSAYRTACSPQQTSFNIGFRVVLIRNEQR